MEEVDLDLLSIEDLLSVEDVLSRSGDCSSPSQLTLTEKQVCEECEAYPIDTLWKFAITLGIKEKKLSCMTEKELCKIIGREVSKLRLERRLKSEREQLSDMTSSSTANQLSLKLLDLPPGVVQMILQRVNTKDLINACQVSGDARKLCDDYRLWRHLWAIRFPDKPQPFPGVKNAIALSKEYLSYDPFVRPKARVINRTMLTTTPSNVSENPPICQVDRVRGMKQAEKLFGKLPTDLLSGDIITGENDIMWYVYYDGSGIPSFIPFTNSLPIEAFDRTIVHKVPLSHWPTLLLGTLVPTERNYDLYPDPNNYEAFNSWQRPVLGLIETDGSFQIMMVSYDSYNFCCDPLPEFPSILLSKSYAEVLASISPALGGCISYIRQEMRDNIEITINSVLLYYPLITPEQVTKHLSGTLNSELLEAVKSWYNTDYTSVTPWWSFLKVLKSIVMTKDEKQYTNFSWQDDFHAMDELLYAFKFRDTANGYIHPSIFDYTLREYADLLREYMVYGDKYLNGSPEEIDKIEEEIQDYFAYENNMEKQKQLDALIQFAPPDEFSFRALQSLVKKMGFSPKKTTVRQFVEFLKDLIPARIPTTSLLTKQIEKIQGAMVNGVNIYTFKNNMLAYNPLNEEEKSWMTKVIASFISTTFHYLAPNEKKQMIDKITAMKSKENKEPLIYPQMFLSLLEEWLVFDYSLQHQRQSALSDLLNIASQTENFEMYKRIKNFINRGLSSINQLPIKSLIGLNYPHLINLPFNQIEYLQPIYDDVWDQMITSRNNVKAYDKLIEEYETALRLIVKRKGTSYKEKKLILQSACKNLAKWNKKLEEAQKTLDSLNNFKPLLISKLKKGETLTDKQVELAFALVQDTFPNGILDSMIDKRTYENIIDVINNTSYSQKNALKQIFRAQTADKEMESPQFFPMQLMPTFEMLEKHYNAKKERKLHKRYDIEDESYPDLITGVDKNILRELFHVYKMQRSAIEKVWRKSPLPVPTSPLPVPTFRELQKHFRAIEENRKSSIQGSADDTVLKELLELYIQQREELEDIWDRYINPGLQMPAVNNNPPPLMEEEDIARVLGGEEEMERARQEEEAFFGNQNFVPPRRNQPFFNNNNN